MATKPSITIATANTHWCQLLTSSEGLKPIGNADIILLQEIIMNEDELKRHLRRSGFLLAASARQFGLAIAVRMHAGLSLLPSSPRQHRLQRMSLVERTLTQRAAKRRHEFVEHGMLAAKFRTRAGHIVTVADVHLSVPLRPFARAAQVAMIGQELADPYYNGALVVGGDMNHYPLPKPIDEAMRSKAGLERVNLGNEPTWFVRGSGQEKYLRIAAFLRRQPIERFNGWHDAMLFRGGGVRHAKTTVVTVESDHRPIVTQFTIALQ